MFALAKASFARLSQKRGRVWEPSQGSHDDDRALLLHLVEDRDAQAMELAV